MEPITSSTNLATLDTINRRLEAMDRNSRLQFAIERFDDDKPEVGHLLNVTCPPNYEGSTYRDLVRRILYTFRQGHSFYAFEMETYGFSLVQTIDRYALCALGDKKYGDQFRSFLLAQLHLLTGVMPHFAMEYTVDDKLPSWKLHYSRDEYFKEMTGGKKIESIVP